MRGSPGAHRGKGNPTMKATKRQNRRLPLPTDATLTITLDTGAMLTLDRMLDVSLPPVPGDAPRCGYMGHGFLVIVTRSVHPEFGPLLHASISHASQMLPQWYVLKALKSALFPENVAAMIPLPEAEHYVDIAECLHIIQCPGPWGNL